MEPQPTKTCRFCGETKPLDLMDTYRKAGKLYYRSRCLSCISQQRREKRQRSLKLAREQERRRAKRKADQRAAGQYTEKFILWDARKSDRKAGRENNLTREGIKVLIDQGCCYCGETEIRMTLDRIDNDKGHTQDNVVPACIRCNYTRKNMPYEAWLVVAKGMREAREKDLFGDWTGRIK
jgi:hypothetical protein